MARPLYGTRSSPTTVKSRFAALADLTAQQRQQPRPRRILDRLAREALSSARDDRQQLLADILVANLALPERVALEAASALGLFARLPDGAALASPEGRRALTVVCRRHAQHEEIWAALALLAGGNDLAASRILSLPPRPDDVAWAQAEAVLAREAELDKLLLPEPELLGELLRQRLSAAIELLALEMRQYCSDGLMRSATRDRYRQLITKEQTRYYQLAILVDVEIIAEANGWSSLCRHHLNRTTAHLARPGRRQQRLASEERYIVSKLASLWGCPDEEALAVLGQVCRALRRHLPRGVRQQWIARELADVRRRRRGRLWPVMVD